MARTRCKMVHIKDKIFAPKLCNCGYFERIGNGKNVGSFFLDQSHGEWYCPGCGLTIPLR